MWRGLVPASVYIENGTSRIGQVESYLSREYARSESHICEAHAPFTFLQILHSRWFKRQILLDNRENKSQRKASIRCGCLPSPQNEEPNEAR